MAPIQETLPPSILRRVESPAAEDPVPQTTAVIQPMWLGPVKGFQRPDQVVVTSDGSRAYATMRTDVVDVGALGNAVLRPAAWAVVCVATFAALVWAWRRARRRRDPAARYCAKCDYELTGLLRNPTPPVTCPECGVDLHARAPVPGESLPRRVAAPVIVLLACIVAGSACEGWLLVTKGRPFATQGTGSAWLYGLAERATLRLPREVGTSGEQLVELNVATGEIARVICSRASQTSWDLAYSERADAVFLRSGGGVELVRVRNGASAAVLEGCSLGSGALVLGEALDRPVAYLNAAEYQRGAQSLLAWDWSRGEKRVILESRYPAAGAARKLPSFVMMSSVPPRFVRYSTPAKTLGVPALLLVDEQGEQVASRENDLESASGGAPAVKPDGSALLVRDANSGSLRVLDGRTLESTAELLPSGGPGYLGMTAQPGGWLVIVPRTQDLAVLDMKTMTWVARLALPADGRMATSITFSGDGKTVLAVLQGDGVAGPFWEMGAWKLPEFK